MRVSSNHVLESTMCQVSLVHIVRPVEFVQLFRSVSSMFVYSGPATTDVHTLSAQVVFVIRVCCR